MDTIKPSGGRRSGRRSGRTPAGRRLVTFAAASLLAGGGLAGASLFAGAPAALADTGPDCPAAVVSGTTATVTCAYTGASQYWTVPAGVTQATFTLYGAAGGPGGANGGYGAEVSGTLPVTPGAALQVNAGQAGWQVQVPGTSDTAGTFGGGGGAALNAGTGGGESDVRVPDENGDYPMSAALLVAGGGGGAGGVGFDANGYEISGGDGGSADAAGQAGTATTDLCGDQLGAPAGGGAGSTAGGGSGGAGAVVTVPAGVSCTYDSAYESAGGDGADGTLGAGGNSGYSASVGGGGGGGGYYGGGGGGAGATAGPSYQVALSAGAGGGGGSSYTGSTGATVTEGVAPPDWAMNGEVVISYQVDQAPAFTADSPALTGGVGTAYSYQFAASGVPAPSFSLASGAPSWLSVASSTGVVSGTPPKGTKSFSYSVTASNAAGSVTAGPYTVAVSVQADVSVALTCPAGLTVGKSGTCTLTVTNNGPALATTVLAGAAAVNGLAVTGCSDSCTELLGAPGWSLGSLPAGQSDTLTFTVTAQRAGTAVVTAADGSLTPDPGLLDNVATATIKITK
jgi:hypothetical protein